ncbi:MAG: aldehyde ferredoxin oxidoreductase family protein [Nitrososphaeria archaeon]
MLYGYMQKVVRVNLSTKKIFIEALDKKTAVDFIGSVGVAGKILYDEVPILADAYDPSNLLIFTTGPVTGTPIQTAGRHSVVTKSPLTGLFGDANAGGFFGVELKRAGYDMVIFSGVSAKPSMLLICDDSIELKEASSYWGMDARDADRAIRSDLGDKKMQVSCIGQAGENLVRFASIMHDDAGRAAARCGVGAVMGFKKLKAVAIRGTKEVPVADSKALNAVMSEVLDNYSVSPLVKRYREGGTVSGYVSYFINGDVPYNNFAGDIFGEYDEERINKLAWPQGTGKILLKNNACYMCAVACRRVVNKGEGKYQLKEENVEGVEYETLAMVGPNCGIDDIYAINLINDLCNRYGLDTISTGVTISFAMECYERGILSKEELDGLDLKFGNSDAAIELVHRIARRDGVGNLLAEGSKRASMMIGRNSDKYAMQVKGLELPGHDPRAFQSGGPHYAYCPVGPDHMEGNAVMTELFGINVPEIGINKQYGAKGSTEWKADLAIKMEDFWTFLTIAGWCIFAGFRYGTQERLIKAFNAITGRQISLSEALMAGERVYNLKRAFNSKHGATIFDDGLPERLLKEPQRLANNEVVKLDVTGPEYLKLRGWDPRTGKPTKEKLLQLGMDDVAGELWK